jgi:L-lactate dehydrogenase complex protein LldE
MAAIKVEILIPCFIDQFKPETGLNMVKVLEKAGCMVHYNPEQTCCGLPAFNAGYWEDSRQVAEKFLNEISTDKNLVCGAGACTAMIRNSYDLLFQNSSYHNKYRQLQKKSFELSEFLIDVLKIENLGSKFEGKVAFFDSCQASEHCKIKTQPRQLLQQVEGLELAELPKQGLCCGFGGTFSVNSEALSVSMAKEVIDQVIESGAKYLISTDYSCLIQIDSILKKQGNTGIEVLHIADILASGI